MIYINSVLRYAFNLSCKVRYWKEVRDTNQQSDVGQDQQVFLGTVAELGQPLQRVEWDRRHRAVAIERHVAMGHTLTGETKINGQRS